ncbi:MAG: hypothetical protein IJK34_00415 [Clostridia bacterium]|nr:hypothetical protein [Clostridia bacterium]
MIIYDFGTGSAEQDTEEWWAALRSTTRELFSKTDVKPEDIEGMAFCSQMQGAVFVDGDGNALRRPMNYLDQRGFIRCHFHFFASILAAFPRLIHERNRFCPVDKSGFFQLYSPAASDIALRAVWRRI